MKPYREYQQNQTSQAPRLCHHVWSSRIYAPRYCILNYECYHCVYDQWLFETDSEAVRKRLTIKTNKTSLSAAA